MKYQTIMLGVLLLASSPLHASNKCAQEKEQTVELDLTEINRLNITLGSDQMRLTGHDGSNLELTVRMCASSTRRLDKMAVEQTRNNDGLSLEFDSGGRRNYTFSLFNRSVGEYGRFEISGRVPQRMLVDLTLASGKAEITGVEAVHSTVGSGHLTLSTVEQAVNTQVNSGRVTVRQSGALHVRGIGSGEVIAEDIKGKTRIESIGSGQARLSYLHGDLDVGSVGSGVSRAKHVSGNVEVGSVGSGSVRVDHAQGNMNVGSVGSGSVNANNIRGNVSLDKKGSGSLRTNNIGGRVLQPGSNKDKLK